MVNETMLISKSLFAVLALAVVDRSNAKGNGTQGAGCYTPQFTLMGLFNFTPPWPPQCTLCATETDPACNGNPCWCIPEGGSEGCCPDPGKRPISYEWQVAQAFQTYQQTLSKPIKLEPEGCDPWDNNRELYPNITKCKYFPGADNPNAVCAFIYKKNDPNCGGLDAREYGLKTFDSYDEAIAAGAVVTHYNACGVCSNAADLGVMMDPRSFYDGRRGRCAGISPADVNASHYGQSIKDGVTYKCYKSTLNLTDECAYLHASSDIAGRACTKICVPVLTKGTSPNGYETCDLNACLACEKSFRKDEYIKWAGRNPVNSGLIAYNQFYHIMMNCSIYEENKIIVQDPYAKGLDSNETLNSANVPAYVAQSADRFNPSYSIILNQETCLYDFSFSVKHDPTLPHAGGWDPNLPNGVTLKEFNAHCSREANLIADDGIEYRARRMHLFPLGDDAKNITGTFDHVSIDYNPCGHQDEDFFGRPHYDMHFYTVSPEWRDIMTCDVTSCDPRDCKYDRTFQSTASGKAFSDMPACSDPFPSYIPADAPVKPGTFKKNMPFGFLSLSHTGNPRSGQHAINVATALNWNSSQVNYWTYPIQFLMSFDNLITVWEPMVPVEFLQGKESRDFMSPETPPLCQTFQGIPLTYNATYNAKTGYTTFQLLGLSPGCACSSSLLTPKQCATHYAEVDQYAKVYKKFSGGKTLSPPPAPAMFGKYSVQDVETAFGLKPGALVLRGTPEFDAFTEKNFWSKYVGKPLILTRFTTIVATPRNEFFSTVATYGKPTFVYQNDRYFEQPLLGCFYRPRSDNITNALISSGLDFCSTFAGVIVEYIVVGYVNEHQRLLLFGRDEKYLSGIQFLTQLVMAEIKVNATLHGKEVFVYQLQGPSYGDYYGYADPEAIQTLDFLGNHGHFEVAVYEPDLTKPCPDTFCGEFAPGLPNPLAPNAPWPTKVLQNQCLWFPCDHLPNCSASDSPYSNQCAGAKSVPTHVPAGAPHPVHNEPTTKKRKRIKKSKNFSM